MKFTLCKGYLSKLIKRYINIQLKILFSIRVTISSKLKEQC